MPEGGVLPGRRVRRRRGKRALADDPAQGAREVPLQHLLRDGLFDGDFRFRVGFFVERGVRHHPREYGSGSKVRGSGRYAAKGELGAEERGHGLRNGRSRVEGRDVAVGAGGGGFRGSGHVVGGASDGVDGFARCGARELREGAELVCGHCLWIERSKSEIEMGSRDCYGREE